MFFLALSDNILFFLLFVLAIKNTHHSCAALFSAHWMEVTFLNQIYTTVRKCSGQLNHSYLSAADWNQWHIISAKMASVKFYIPATSLLAAYMYVTYYDAAPRKEEVNWSESEINKKEKARREKKMRDRYCQWNKTKCQTCGGKWYTMK